MEPIKPLIYDFYANTIIKRLQYCETVEEVIDFYRNDLLPGLEEGKLSIQELKKRFLGNRDYRLETLVGEMDKTIS